MTIRTAALAGLCLLAAACSSAPPKPWLQRYHAEVDCGSAIKTQLRDPDSYQLISLLPEENQKDPEAGLALISFRAKNGFGGYDQAMATCERVKQGEEYVVNAKIIGQ